jgi:hypothetical protein
MTHQSRLVLSVSLLLTDVSVGQQTQEQARAAVSRDAERYAQCEIEYDRDCLRDMTHFQALQIAGRSAAEMDRQVAAPAYIGNSRYVAHEFEIAPPWEPFAADEWLVAFVPYFETSQRSATGRRLERIGYLIGISDDDGGSWRFIPVHQVSVLQPGEVDRAIPGLGDRPRPETHDLSIRDPVVSKSRWMQTRDSRFVFVEEAMAYFMTFEMRKEIDETLDLMILYDNPEDPDRPFSFRGSLLPGQQLLEWQSPALSSFSFGESYAVVLEVSDPATGKVLFKHSQGVLFQPTREMWRAIMSKEPRTEPTN